MSKIALNSTPGDSGTVTFTSPLTNSSRTLTIPDKTGTLSVITDFTDGLTAPSFASMNSGPLGGFRNILVNGGFDVFQRGVNETVPTQNYVLDRWGKHQYQVSAHSRQAFVPGGTHPGNARYVLRASGDGVQSGMRLHAAQGIELTETAKLRGKTVILSGYVRFSAATLSVATPPWYAMVAYSNSSNDLNFGSTNWAADGNNTVSINQGSLPTTWQKFSVSATIGVSAQNVVCVFYTAYMTTPLSTDWFELSNVQLEVGSVATPFETRPYTLELHLCGSPASNSLGFTRGITVTDVNGGQLAGFRNKIINGGFDVWQRGTSGFSLNSYCADRWYTDAGTSVSRSTDVPPGFAYSAKHTGVTFAYAAHRTGIELPGTGVQGEYYDGATFTFSCLCKTSVAGKTLILYSAFTTAVGVAGSRTVSSIDIGTTSTSWTKYTYTFTIPTGASIATAKCLEVTPYVNAPNCDVYITGVQLESGTVATPFEFRPYSVELALCQRYYLRIKHEQRVYAPAASANGFTISHPTMRVVPTWSTLTTGTLVNASTATAVAYGDSQSLLTLNSSAAGDSYITGRVYESTGTEL